jgi:hypothetical protein
LLESKGCVCPDASTLLSGNISKEKKFARLIARGKR